MKESSSSLIFQTGSSLSRRFSVALIGVVTFLLIIFSAIIIVTDIIKVENDLEVRLQNAINVAKESLPTPLWNLDHDLVRDFINALFLNESIIYAKVSWQEKIIAEKERSGFQWPRQAGAEAVTSLPQSDFIFKFSEISFEDKPVGRILIVMSRKTIKKKVFWQIWSVVALTGAIIAGIWLTTLFITKRYISTPLSKLQGSASSIAHGDLDTFIDKSSDDEIGMLGKHLDAMRRSIKHLFAELNESKVKLEEYNWTLEQKVELRTEELSRTVEELTALGEVSQAVSSTLDLEKVLSSIVTHAVKLSKADEGTIYELDEAEDIFIPRINFGVSEKLIEKLKEAKIRPGDKTLIGRVASTGLPDQVSDLTKLPDYPIPYVLEAGYRAILAVPFLWKNRMIGGLIVRRKSAGKFPKSVVDVLETFAAQSVLAIHNARLFQEIEKKGRELEIANKHKSEFLANMSHELRTPLNAILGYTELILDAIYGEVPDQIREILERLEKNGRHLLGLINNVLDLSKIEAGRLTLSLNPYSMGETVKAVITSVESLAAEKKLDLKVSIAEDLEIGIGDEQRIAQVLLNLIGNAIKFTDRGTVEVEVKAADEMFVVSVSDTGPGLSETDQEGIFKEFHQADGSITREKGGTGLGLSIAKRIVEMHGGRIWVESKLGQGSSFHAMIPTRVERHHSQR